MTCIVAIMLGAVNNKRTRANEKRQRSKSPFLDHIITHLTSLTTTTAVTGAYNQTIDDVITIHHARDVMLNSGFLVI